MSFSNLFFSLIGALGFYVLLSSFWKRGPSGRLASGLGQPHQPDLVLTDMPLPLGQRALAQPLADLGARVSRGDPNDIEDRLRRSGWRYTSTGDYYGSKVMSAIVLFVVAAVIAIVLRLPVPLTVLIAVGAGAVGLFSPDQEIGKATERRRKALFREMAWTLDRLAVVMETGLGLDTALKDLIWISKGRGGLFMALLRDLVNALFTRETNVQAVLERLRATAPRMPELDTFLQLVKVHLEQTQPIAHQLKALATHMRDELTNDIETRRQAAEMRIVFLTSGVIVPAMLIVIGGPAVLGFLRFMG